MEREQLEKGRGVSSGFWYPVSMGGAHTLGLFQKAVMISAATEEMNLSATEGGNITLPDPVMEFGFIIFNGNNVAFVTKGEVVIAEDIYTNRLHWDKNTGLFTITGLQRNDSGIYTINSKRVHIFTKYYNLTVYERVPSPAVNTVSVSTESCILLCSVDKAETTLLWYKDEEILNQSSSALSLPLTVHKQDFNSSYRCVAANPAEHKTLHVNIITSCSEQNNKTPDETERHSKTI
ncbi:CD48 antigen-like [Scomber japonicus]|uniref:CD48 antigen-like n=1 Tax=Scomber japonicus TaxID=13676 RepID=UPI002306C610|nr:CD48 antigen-like [Scomber japonicus]